MPHHTQFHCEVHWAHELIRHGFSTKESVGFNVGSLVVPFILFVDIVDDNNINIANAGMKDIILQNVIVVFSLKSFF